MYPPQDPNQPTGTPPEGSDQPSYGTPPTPPAGGDQPAYTPPAEQPNYGTPPVQGLPYGTPPAYPQSQPYGTPPGYPPSQPYGAPSYPQQPGYGAPPGYPPQQPGYGAPPGYPPSQPYGAPPGYGNAYVMPLTVSAPTNGLAITSMILGIVSLVFFCAWYLSLPAGITGIILGAIGLNQINKGNYSSASRGMAIAGLITAGIGIVVTLLLVIFVFSLFRTLSTYSYSSY